MEKTIKVYGKFQKRKFKNDGFFPHISLSGQWVENAGFELGKQVFVTVENGRMIIENEQTYEQARANRG